MDTATRSAGYHELIVRYQLDVPPHWHTSLVSTGSQHRRDRTEGRVTEIYPASYWPGDTIGAHLEFALKYDGLNLSVLSALFSVVDQAELTSYVASKPLGKYTRRVWFFYEFLTDHTLPLEDLNRGNYIDLLEPELYYTLSPASRVKRQRINQNMLGGRGFCPVVRRTQRLMDFESAQLDARCREIVTHYSPHMLQRAMSYLYTKETKSSFEIEREKPQPSRTARFVALLQLAEREDFCTKERLIDLQNRTVDPRFCDVDYRVNQNYVGESLPWGRERVHYVCPHPESVPQLMAGLIKAHRRMEAGAVHAAVHAAVVAYAFVFIHPFEDGNGRIHRFLIHNILARRGFSPAGLTLPVSAAMLNDQISYDQSLEVFSQPLLSLINYVLDEQGQMTVLNHAHHWYAYSDLTPQVEALTHFIERAVTQGLVEELSWIERYDRVKEAIQEIVDLPDRQIELLIKVCLQNNGRLSSRKRSAHFELLTEGEIAEIEAVVRAVYHPKDEL